MLKKGSFAEGLTLSHRLHGLVPNQLQCALGRVEVPEHILVQLGHSFNNEFSKLQKQLRPIDSFKVESKLAELLV